MFHRTVFSFCALLFVLVLALCAPHWGMARGLTCDFYDISDIPEGWTVSLPPGFNERKSSLGHYVNTGKNASVMIQVSETKTFSTLEEVTAQSLTSLRSNGCTILQGPVTQGELVRLEVTMTGTPATMWIGTDSDVVAVTVISGDQDECRRFLSFLRASPRLIPSAEQVMMP